MGQHGRVHREKAHIFCVIEYLVWCINETRSEYGGYRDLEGTHSLTYSLTHLLTYSLTHSLTHPLTHSLTYSLTHLLTYSLTHFLKVLHQLLMTNSSEKVWKWTDDLNKREEIRRILERF
jgi:hypothetical protein